MRRPLLLLPLLGLLVGCAHRVDFGALGRIEDPAYVLETLRARAAQVHGLVATGKLEVDSLDGKGTLAVAVEVAEPAKIYLETADFLGTPRGVFTTDGERFAFYLPDEDLLVRGPATEENLGRFLPIAAPPEALARALLGELLLEAPTRTKLSLDERRGRYVLELADATSRQRIEVATDDLRLLAVESRGSWSFDAMLDEHEELLPGVPFARRIELVDPRRRERVRLRYGELELNPRSSEATFELATPPGARLELLDG